jgi:hypothetical protein
MMGRGVSRREGGRRKGGERKERDKEVREIGESREGKRGKHQTSMNT